MVLNCGNFILTHKITDMKNGIYFLSLLLLIVGCGKNDSYDQNIGELIINGDLDIVLDTVLTNLSGPEDVFIKGDDIFYSEENMEPSGENDLYNILSYNELTGATDVIMSVASKPFGLLVMDSALFIAASDEESDYPENGYLVMYNLLDNTNSKLADSLAVPLDLDADSEGNLYLGAITKDNIRNPLIKLKAPEYIDYERQLDGSGEVLGFDFGNDFIWFSNAGGIAKTQERNTWSVSFINGVTSLLVTSDHIYYAKYDYNLLGRINMFTGENEILLENILRPYKMSYNEATKALYLIINDNTKKHTSTLLKMTVGQDIESK